MIPKENNCILQVEDEENDIFMLREVFTRVGVPCPLKAVKDGATAIDYLEGKGKFSDRKQNPLPCLVLLDLKLPKLHGFDVLEWIRKHPELKKLVVVVFSSSSMDPDVRRASELGANSYIVKPGEFEKTMEIAQLLKGWWLGYHQFAPVA